MAINKKLIHFKNKENFDKEVANENILDTSIVFIQDSKEISTHGTVYKTVNWSVLEPKLALAGDICLYDKSADKLIIISASEDLANYPADNYSPVGVVVIPSTHDVYGDGSCAVISIKPMDCSTPIAGGRSEQTMYCGAYGPSISGLSNLNLAPYVGIGSSVGNTTSTVVGTNKNIYLPSDKFSTVQCPHDTDTYYKGIESVYYQAPSPFLTDGSRNPAYYQTSSPSSKSNALADFDGVGNTNKIITQRGTKDYASWKPTYNTGTDYPAASCCDMYYTDGTKQGDWYLPACGELGYIVPNFNKINTTIITLIDTYSVGNTLGSSNNYWSSSQYFNGLARFMDMFEGQLDYTNRDSSYYVRAFLRVKP